MYKQAPNVAAIRNGFYPNTIADVISIRPVELYHIKRKITLVGSDHKISILSWAYATSIDTRNDNEIAYHNKKLLLQRKTNHWLSIEKSCNKKQYINAEDCFIIMKYGKALMHMTLLGSTHWYLENISNVLLPWDHK